MNTMNKKYINLDRRSFLKMSSSVGFGLALGGSALAQQSCSAKAGADTSPSGVITPPEKIDNVRIGVIGLGVRGTELIHALLDLPGNQITAVCDIAEDKTHRVSKLVADKGFAEPKRYYKGEKAFLKLCEQEDVDLVIAATPVDWHVPNCVAAMKNGKHCATEVHATYNMDECWELVETAEKYNKQCALLENYCYIRELMMVLRMAREGLLGDLVFAESGYEHDCRPFRFGSDGSLLWRAYDLVKHNGNLYPTHAIGPVAQWFNINRGDRFDYLVSMSSRASGMKHYAQQRWGKDHPSARLEYAQGDMSSTMLHSANGATFTLYYDASLPRPYVKNYRVQGTGGIYMATTDQIYLEGRSEKYDQYEPASKYRPEYDHPLWQSLGDKAGNWGHWGSDYLMMYRLVEAFRRGENVDMDVYDAAVWSAISPLSEQSVAKRSSPIDFPDFTRGKWKTNKPLGIMKA